MAFYVPEDTARRLRPPAPAFPSPEEADAAPRGVDFAPMDASPDAAPRGNPFTLGQPEPAGPPPNPFLAMQAQQSEDVFARNRVAGPSSSPLDFGLGLLNALGHNLDRPRGALLAASEQAAGSPIPFMLRPSVWQAAGRGFNAPEQFSADAVLGRAGWGDESLWGQKRFLPDDISARNLVGGLTDLVADPTNLLGAKKAADVAEFAQPGIKQAASDVATKTATRLAREERGGGALFGVDATPLALIDNVATLPSMDDFTDRLREINDELSDHISPTTGKVKLNKRTRALLEEQGRIEGVIELRKIVDAADGDADKAALYLEQALEEHDAWEGSRTYGRGSTRPKGEPDPNTGKRTRGGKATAKTFSQLAGAPPEEIEVLRARASVLNDVFGALERAESLDDLLRPINDVSEKAGILPRGPAAAAVPPPAAAPTSLPDFSPERYQQIVSRMQELVDPRKTRGMTSEQVDAELLALRAERAAFATAPTPSPTSFPEQGAFNAGDRVQAGERAGVVHSISMPKNSKGTTPAVRIRMDDTGKLEFHPIGNVSQEFPEQIDLEGNRISTFRPENTPLEQQGAMPIGAGEQPVESLPLFEQASSPPAQVGAELANPVAPLPPVERKPIWAGGSPPGEASYPWSNDPSGAAFTQPEGEFALPSGRGIGPSGQVAQPPTVIDAPVWQGKTAAGAPPSNFPPQPPSVPGQTPSGRAPGPSGNTFAPRRPSPLLPRQYRGNPAPAPPWQQPHNRTPGRSAVQYGEDWYAQAGEAVPVGVHDALAQVDEMASPRAGNAVRAALTPARGQSPRVWRAWQAMGNTEADIATRLISWEARTLERIEDLFGGTDRVNVDYIGPSVRRQASVDQATGQAVLKDVPAAEWLPNAKGESSTGSFKDMLENPDYYDLTPAQRNYLREFNQDMLRVNEDLRAEYGTEIGDYVGRATPQQVANGEFGFLPSVNASEEIEQAADANRISKPGSSGRLKTREYDSMAIRAEHDAYFKPITDVAELLPGLNRAKARAAARDVFDAAVGGSRVDDPALIQASNGSWLPPKEAADVAKLMELFTPGNIVGKAISAVESANEAALSGDFSPIFIHGALGFLGKPWRTAQLTAGGLIRAAREGDPLRFAKPRVLADEIEQAVRNGDSSWLDFAQQKGMPFVKSVQEEFSGGWIRRVPGLGSKWGQMNEALYTIVIRQQKGLWDDVTQSLVTKGVPRDQAMSEAMRLAERLIPTANPRRAGNSQYRAVLERLPFTSISFIRQPLAMSETAGRGLLKMAANPTGWKNLTAEEQLAVEIMLKFHATAATLAVSTAALNAYQRGDDVTERVMNVLNPASGDFLAIYDPTGKTGWSAPAGGPYRALWKAVAPRRQKLPGGHEVWVPFAGLPQWGAGRVQVTAGRALEVHKNKDFNDNPIMTSEFGPLRIMQGLAHIAAGALPLTASQPLESQRAGESLIEGAVKTVGQVAGVTPRLEAFSRVRDRAARAAGYESWGAMGSGDRANLLKANSELAAGEAKELDQGLRRGDEWAVNRQALNERYAKTYEEQSVDDELLGQPNGLSVGDWKDRRKVRLDEQRGAIEQIMRNAPEQTPDPAKPWTLYYAKVREQEQLGGGQITQQGWDAIDTWRASLTDAQNEAIDRQIGYRSTPKEQEYRADLKRLNDSGYFEIRDNAWAAARAADPTAANFATKGEWEEAWRRELAGGARQLGIPEDGAQFDQLLDKVLRKLPASKAYSEASKVGQAQWLPQALSDGSYKLVYKWQLGDFESDLKKVITRLELESARQRASRP